MYKTYKNIIDTIRTVALLTGTTINSVVVGNSWEIATKTINYPLLFVDTLLKDHQYNNGSVTFSVDLYFIDTVYDDESNEDYVLSDMTTLCLDFINHFKDNFELYGFWINKDINTTINFQQFTEQFDDKVSGVKCSLEIKVPDGGNECENVFKNN